MRKAATPSALRRKLDSCKRSRFRDLRALDFCLLDGEPGLFIGVA